MELVSIWLEFGEEKLDSTFLLCKVGKTFAQFGPHSSLLVCWLAG